MHGLDVEVERKVPIVVAAFQHRAMMHEAGGVEQHVDGTDPLGHGRDGGAVADIEAGHFRDAFARQCSEFLVIDIGRDHGRAFACESDRARAADACCRRSHECALAFQSAGHCQSP